jgi:pimeloyl-ACP methyl ester carboxylesterase
MSEKPTIVLVHGAFADASTFAPVTERLLDAGFRVSAPPVFNRSLSGDAAYIRSFVEQIDGPVVLVGHSYGGAVTTVAGVAENVIGLVFLSGYALEEGESLAELQGGFPDSPLIATLVYAPYPIEGSDKPGTDVSVKVSSFDDIFAAGVDPSTLKVLAVSQRPLAAVAFSEAATAASWKTKPGWGIVSKNDRTINPEVERFGYKRAGLKKVLELESSHLVMLTHPDEVTQFITDAAAEFASDGASLISA